MRWWLVWIVSLAATAQTDTLYQQIRVWRGSRWDTLASHSGWAGGVWQAYLKQLFPFSGRLPAGPEDLYAGRVGWLAMPVGPDSLLVPIAQGRIPFTRLILFLGLPRSEGGAFWHVQPIVPGLTLSAAAGSFRSDGWMLHHAGQHRYWHVNIAFQQKGHQLMGWFQRRRENQEHNGGLAQAPVPGLPARVQPVRWMQAQSKTKGQQAGLEWRWQWHRHWLVGLQGLLDRADYHFREEDGDSMKYIQQRWQPWGYIAWTKDRIHFWHVRMGPVGWQSQTRFNDSVLVQRNEMGWGGQLGVVWSGFQVELLTYSYTDQWNYQMQGHYQYQKKRWLVRVGGQAWQYEVLLPGEVVQWAARQQMEIAGGWRSVSWVLLGQIRHHWVQGLPLLDTALRVKPLPAQAYRWWAVGGQVQKLRGSWQGVIKGFWSPGLSYWGLPSWTVEGNLYIRPGRHFWMWISVFAGQRWWVQLMPRWRGWTYEPYGAGVQWTVSAGVQWLIGRAKVLFAAYHLPGLINPQWYQPVPRRLWVPAMEARVKWDLFH